jgi:hypothetical protein
MPLPRKKDDGTGGAPVLDILQARVRLLDVEEHVEPYTVTRKKDGAEFSYDPDFKCTVEVVDDGADGTDNGTKFFERFRYKMDKSRAWHNQENSKLGMLAKVVKQGYFEDPSIPELEAEDLEGFEMMCSIKPKRNLKNVVIGSTIEWDTMRPVRKLATVPDQGPSFATEADEEEDDFDSIPS